MDDRAAPLQTLEQAKEWLRERLEDGALCPCCGCLAKIYKRKLNSGMAACLIALHQIEHQVGVKGAWIYAPDWVRAYPILATSREYPKLVYWELLEDRAFEEGEITHAKCSGHWRLTEQGRRFVRGEIRVKRHVFVYGGRVLRFGDDTITIWDALGDKFDYQELMGVR